MPDRMSVARTKYAARHRFRSYLFPIAVMFGAMAIAVDSGPAAYIPLSPLIAAAILNRCRWGITAGRVSAAIGIPLCLYLGWLSWTPQSPWVENREFEHIVWFVAYIAGFIALCFEPAKMPPALPMPPARSVPAERARQRRRMLQGLLPSTIPVDRSESL